MENQINWVSDPAHSEILFKVKHLMITNVKGEFQNFKAEIRTHGAQFDQGKVSAKIETASIFTNNKDRDAHLQSADFFNAEAHPSIDFEGTALTRLDEDNFKLEGQLSMNGITKPVSLDVEFGGLMKDPYGNEKAGFSFSGKINRKDWGLNWNTALETGGVMVSEEVRLNGELQFVKQA